MYGASYNFISLLNVHISSLCIMKDYTWTTRTRVEEVDNCRHVHCYYSTMCFDLLALNWDST